MAHDLSDKKIYYQVVDNIIGEIIDDTTKETMSNVNEETPPVFEDTFFCINCKFEENCKNKKMAPLLLHNTRKGCGFAEKFAGATFVLRENGNTLHITNLAKAPTEKLIDESESLKTAYINRWKEIKAKFTK